MSTTPGIAPLVTAGTLAGTKAAGAAVTAPAGR
jgi:hypothetical protein